MGLALPLVTLARQTSLSSLGVLLVCFSACSVVEWVGEGEPCSSRRPCSADLSCTAAVGAEYGYSSDTAVCEVPRAVYGFIAQGERGESRRIDEALDMLEGKYVLPRMAAEGPGLATVAHSLQLADGSSLVCSSSGSTPPCLVPDWPRYFGTALEKYPRFILFGLRMTGALLFTEAAANSQRLRERLAQRTGRPSNALNAEEVRGVRRRAGHLALALFDSFVAHGHRPLALEALPPCYTGTSGYPNPNASWAPELAHLDPSRAVSPSGRLVSAYDVPVDCSRPGELSYADLRESVWDRHGSSFRALALTNAYFHFRGLLPKDRQKAWLQALRDTGNALALPSSYEFGDNHGITEAAALLQVGLAFQEIPDADQELGQLWLTLGRHRFNDVVADTVFDDGVQVEQSPFYHVYELSLLLQINDWLQRNGLDLATGVDPRYAEQAAAIPPEQRLDYDSTDTLADPDVNRLTPRSDLDLAKVVGKMARAAAHLGQPNGWMPLLGSSLPLQLRGYQPEVFDPFFQQGSPEARMLAAYHRAQPRPHIADGVTVFENSGYVTIHGPGRSQAARAHLLFNAGMPYHEHSHADSLSLHLYGPEPGSKPASGLPLLIDSGWFSYRRTERHYFESTLAHNTVAVDGTNQCLRVTASKRATAYLEQPALLCEDLGLDSPSAPAEPPPGTVARGLTLAGEREGVPFGYQSARHRLYRDITHRRGVLLMGSEVLIVVDELYGRQPHAFAQHWHLTPEISDSAPDIDPTARRWTFHSGGQAGPEPLISLHQLDTDGQTTVRFHYGAPDIDGVPGLGWHSHRENQREPHVVAEFRREGESRAHFVSIFLLGSHAAASPRLQLEHPEQGAFQIDVQLPDMAWTLSIEHLAEGAPAETVVIAPRPGG